MFTFENDEQLAIRKSVRAFAESRIPSFQSEDRHGTLPRELFSAAAGIGLGGLAIDEQHGGIRAGALTTMIAMEELARVDLGPAIFVSVHSMVSGLIQRFGTAAQLERLLPKLASGEWLGAYGLTEPGAGSDAASLSTHAVETPNGYSLTGEKCYITSAGFADIYLIFARMTSLPSARPGDQICAFIVEKDRPGFSCARPEKKMGCELSPIASITLSGVELPKENLLGHPGQGYQIALSGLAGGRINIASCANGLSSKAIELALAHLVERKQFGQRLADFQGLQFMLADMQMQLEAARLLTWQAAQQVERDAADHMNRIYPSYAKCFATDAAMKITTDAVQLLGGAGYIREYTVERLMRDAKMLQIVEGTNQIQRSVIARELVRGIGVTRRL